MALFFLASIAGLFPGLSLPFELGWKALHPFDLLFLACLALAALKRAFRPPDWELILAGAALVAASGLAWLFHPSPSGIRAVSTLAYSVGVLLAVSHVRLDVIGVRLERVILPPLLIAIGVAWTIFLFENLTGVSVGGNQSAALPKELHRLGGLTGANALILFLGLAAPLARSSGFALGGVLSSAFLTLSRSMMGVGVGLLLRERLLKSGPRAGHRSIEALSWLTVILGLFAYAFAVVPVETSQRTPFKVSLEPGGYLTLHQASLRMIAAHPVLGVGPGRFPREFRRVTTEAERVRIVEKDFPAWDPHSAILGLTAEQGFIGLAAFAWLFHVIFQRLRRIPELELRAGAIAGLAGLLVGGLFVDWIALKGLWLWIGLFVCSPSSAQGNLHRTSL